MKKQGKLKPGEVITLPRVYSGKPIVEGAPVDILANRFMGGESISELASDYGVARKSVEAAIRYQFKARESEEKEIIGLP